MSATWAASGARRVSQESLPSPPSGPPWPAHGANLADTPSSPPHIANRASPVRPSGPGLRLESPPRPRVPDVAASVAAGCPGLMPEERPRLLRTVAQRTRRRPGHAGGALRLSPSPVRLHPPKEACAICSPFPPPFFFRGLVVWKNELQAGKGCRFGLLCGASLHPSRAKENGGSMPRLPHGPTGVWTRLRPAAWRSEPRIKNPSTAAETIEYQCNQGEKKASELHALSARGS